jgi:hypothetical protein
MSSLPQDDRQPSTADLVSAGTPRRPDDARDDPPRNVRRMEPAARPDAGAGRGRDAGGEAPSALVPADEGANLRRRWDAIQTGFVDEPRRAVQDADTLVAQTMKRVAEVFAQERASLEQQWSRGQDVSTEDLRVALKRYRSFFDRLLSV